MKGKRKIICKRICPPRLLKEMNRDKKFLWEVKRGGTKKWDVLLEEKRYKDEDFSLAFFVNLAQSWPVIQLPIE